MTDYSLIQKLETVRQGLPDVKYISGFMIAMDIVRQHSPPRPTSIAHAEMQDEQRGQALNRTVGRVQNGGEREHHEQPQDMVKRVAEAISDAMIWNGTVMCTSPEDLANQGVPVRVDYRYAIMHDKFIVVDGETVETGSFNYTAAAGRNAENVIVLHDPAVAQQYWQEWERLWGESEPLIARY